MYWSTFINSPCAWASLCAGQCIWNFLWPTVVVSSSKKIPFSSARRHKSGSTLILTQSFMFSSSPRQSKTGLLSSWGYIALHDFSLTWGEGVSLSPPWPAPSFAFCNPSSTQLPKAQLSFPALLQGTASALQTKSSLVGPGGFSQFPCFPESPCNSSSLSC